MPSVDALDRETSRDAIDFDIVSMTTLDDVIITSVLSVPSKTSWMPPMVKSPPTVRLEDTFMSPTKSNLHCGSLFPTPIFPVAPSM